MATEDPQVRPQVIDDGQVKEPPKEQQQTQTYGEPRAVDPAAAYRYAQQQQRKPAGPQLWAVVFTLAGLYYLWTRLLGKSLPGFGGGHRVKGRSINIIGNNNSSNNNRQAEIAAARERQQQRLELMAKTKNNKNDSNIRERTNVTSSGNSTTNNKGLSILEQQQLLQKQKERKQKEQEMEQKKKKQRALYLKQKAEREKEEEKRRKDEELGPGWEYRSNPDAATAVNNMNPQSGGSGGGGYKPQRCTPRGG